MGFPSRKIFPPPTYTPPGTIFIREGFGPLELSPGFFDHLNFSHPSVGEIFLQSRPLFAKLDEELTKARPFVLDFTLYKPYNIG